MGPSYPSSGALSNGLDPCEAGGKQPADSEGKDQLGTVSPSKTLAGTGNRRIFAYIICVKDYEAEKVPNLRACVEDGKKFEAFLRAKFYDQALQINPLYNEEATYDGILSLFEVALSNTLVQKGDLVIFFYAGHGSRTPAPKSWQTEDGRIETICPYDIETKKGGKEIYGIPDFVVGTVMKNIADNRGANVLLIFDSCYSAGMARDKNEFLRPRYTDSNRIPEELLNDLLSKYPEKSPFSPTDPNSLSPFTLLAACGKYETAHEKLSTSWEGAFTNALIEQLNKVPWYNLSYATLCKSLPKLPHQTPECIGESNRVVFTLDRAEDEGLYFDIKESTEKVYTVKDAGRALGIGKGTKFKIRGPEAQDLGTLIVDDVKDVEPSQCRVRAELSTNNQGGIPEGAKAFLHHWSLSHGPLRVGLGLGIERPTQTESVEIIDQHSEAQVVVTKRGDTWELARRNDSYVVGTAAAPNIKLPKGTDSEALAIILNRIARFHHHLLRGSPGDVNSSIVADLCQVEKGEDGRYRTKFDGSESGTRVMRDTVELHFRPEARYGIIIKNYSGHVLYPYLFYFDPSDYAIHAVYPPLNHGSEPLYPDGERPIGFGSSSAPPIKFYLTPGEGCDVGYIRLFVSTTKLPMDIIRQPPITKLTRHYGQDPEIADTKVWDVRTIVLRVEREKSPDDIFTKST